MRAYEWRCYQKLAAAVLVEAIKNIRRGKIDINGEARADMDLKWIHDRNSNFEIWCQIAGVHPGTIRKLYQPELAKNFKFVKHGEFYKLKSGITGRAKI